MPTAHGNTTSSVDGQGSVYTNATLQMLSGRDLIASVSSSHISAHLSSQPRTIYLGVDPTAPSLHLGNLVPIIALIWLVKAGHRGILLIGGATGSIGDPSGKSTERPDMDRGELHKNVQALKSQLDSLIRNLNAHFGGAASASSDNGGVQRTPLEEAAAAGTGAAAERAADEVIGGPSAQGNSTAPVAGSQALEEGAERSATGALDIQILNNQDFYEGIGILDFLRDIGRYVRIGEVLARDSVKTRLPPPHGTSTSPHAGLSYTEFSYQLLQAYDFYLLNARPDIGCSMQIGGSDQMGNISAGVELIRRKRFGSASNALQEADLDDTQAESPAAAASSSSSRRLPPAYGMTLPLLTTSSGAKLGKSAGNAIFLSRDLCSDYDFYQYLLRTTDEDVTKLLHCLTFLSSEEIAAAEGARGARQVLLADEVTRLFRGPEALASAKRMTNLLHVAFAACEGRGGLQETLDSHDGMRNELHLMARASESMTKADAKVLRLSKGNVLGQSLVDVLVLTGLADSKVQARRLLQGGAYLNNVPLTSDSAAAGVFTEKDVATFRDRPEEGIVLLRKGKRTAKVLLLV
ncbi:hypothetical protein BCV69DRAFT_298525 [Microstroma glucosiphilum]|uniref:tyrosine--tRNA ligase n=1 Tax=Pseudomicrostroma glucosiphilum TaxID=1684307 RepID=A0A316UEI9_9BASI|nr:hypothetical protein BCV69DRAFT_298525 [Pseudomicrostroma glucosiphilum]PWN21515.1 hypothetical protein BCV69DRAFT_298525 [Pseudomicrostroma glucosiphilum]